MIKRFKKKNIFQKKSIFCLNQHQIRAHLTMRYIMYMFNNADAPASTH